MACVAYAFVVGALALQPPRLHVGRGVRQLTTAMGMDDADEELAPSNVTTIYSSKKHSDEVLYPYEIYDTTPPRNMIGVFPLSPTIGSGDILKVENEDGDSAMAYMIKRVASKMRFSNGRFLLESKRADATEVNRAQLEKRLARLLPKDARGS